MLPGLLYRALPLCVFSFCPVRWFFTPFSPETPSFSEAGRDLFISKGRGPLDGKVTALQGSLLCSL